MTFSMSFTLFGCDSNHAGTKRLVSSPALLLQVSFVLVACLIDVSSSFLLPKQHTTRTSSFYSRTSANPSRRPQSWLIPAKKKLTTFGSHSESNKHTEQKKRQPLPAEFELQELRAQIAGMFNAGLASADLTAEKKDELSSYVKAVAFQRPSPIPMEALGLGDYLEGTWRLAFTTEAAALSVLPREARVYVNIYGGGRLDYILKFTAKVFALKSLTAKSSYTVDTSTVNPGLLTFTYEEISADIFGIPVPTGLFGMLKGRSNYIESIYFDGNVWIDRGFTPEGVEYFNVYVGADLE